MPWNKRQMSLVGWYLLKTIFFVSTGSFLHRWIWIWKWSGFFVWCVFIIILLRSTFLLSTKPSIYICLSGYNNLPQARDFQYIFYFTIIFYVISNEKFLCVKSLYAPSFLQTGPTLPPVMTLFNWNLLI